MTITEAIAFKFENEEQQQRFHEELARSRADLHAENQRLSQALYVSNERLREAERRASAAEDGLRGLVRFAASVWYDEGNCTEEEGEAMYAARVALSKL